MLLDKSRRMGSPISPNHHNHSKSLSSSSVDDLSFLVSWLGGSCTGMYPFSVTSQSIEEGGVVGGGMVGGACVGGGVTGVVALDGA